MCQKKNHLFYLEKCLSLASQSVDNGNHPFGALLVHENKIIATAENEVVTRKDITAHAELRLIQKTQSLLTSEELKESALYTSTEPCPMCVGAIYWSGVSKIVFGCSAEQLYNIVHIGFTLSSRDILKQSIGNIEIIDFSNEPRFSKIHSNFWPAL